MAKSKKSISTKKNIQKNEEPKSFKNPTETWWGKTLIWLLIVGTLAGIFVGAIIGLIEAL